MILDVVYIKHSMNRNVPWGTINLGKLILTGALILLTALDLFITTCLKKSELSFPVDYYTPLIKISSFVSSKKKTLHEITITELLIAE